MRDTGLVRVLVVDDDEAVRSALTHALHRDGYEVSTAVDGAAALATLLGKFKGPGAYEGLWELLARTYRALADGSALPVAASDVLEVNRMVEALKPNEQRQ